MLVTQAGLARRLQVSKSTINRAVQKGRIMLNAEGKVDLESALKAFEDTKDRTQDRRPPPVTPTREGVTFAELQSRKLALQCALLKQEHDRESGKLVEVEEVQKVAFETARTARDLLLAVPDRIAPIVAGIDNPFEVNRIISEELRNVCEQISG